MKKLIIITIFLLSGVFAQAQTDTSYQGFTVNLSGNILALDTTASVYHTAVIQQIIDIVLQDSLNASIRKIELQDKITAINKKMNDMGRQLKTLRKKL